MESDAGPPRSRVGRILRRSLKLFESGCNGSAARTKRRMADDLDEIALHCSTLPVLDRRSAEDIMGYDENGLPR